MDKEYFLNAGIPPSLHFEPSQWQPLTSVPELNSWEKSTDQFTHFESALSSMVSSPAASNSAISGDNFVIRELIGKLGSICNPGDMSPSMMAATSYIGGGGNNSTNTSCYSTPLNSPPKLHMPIMDNFVSENLPNLGSSMPLSPALLAVSSDPGFAERAAKFSCFGSRSFNGRTNQVNSNPADFLYRSSNSMVASAKLPRVCSSPSLKAVGSQLGVQEMKNSAHTHMEMKPSDKKFSGCGANSNEESSVSEQITLGESVNPRKRKAVSKGKAKEAASKVINYELMIETISQEAEADHDDCNTKKSKQTEGSGNENGSVKASDESKEQEGNNTSSKPPEPPKDYIHVRARRGQATDSHSLAERVRREKISERMKLLQDLVPGCNKVTGKALMLDEIINYVQSLQRQVEFLSMKLATINPRLDFNMDSLLSKDVS
ncbi:hypothetical protein RJ639_039736 [Escallonia herrerae]|uniref:BHLH domain-containing protein n=1 Tax=Escallonia herrerae TaxID=1293975 RepID=A0AA88WLE6_9ASTE|nr:hypothetical protein RJ639_039736 [Escallonia herrerae]